MQEISCWAAARGLLARNGVYSKILKGSSILDTFSHYDVETHVPRNLRGYTIPSQAW